MLSLGNLPDLYEAHRIRPKGRKNVFLVPKRIFHPRPHDEHKTRKSTVAQVRLHQLDPRTYKTSLR